MRKKRLLACMLTLSILAASGVQTCPAAGEEAVAAVEEVCALAADQAINPEAAEDPSVESPVEPTEVPADDTSMEQPVVVPTAEPTMQPEPSPETSVEPIVPSEEPAAEDLSVWIKSNRSFAFANEDTVRIDVAVGGGAAPYSVHMQISGAADFGEKATLQEAGVCSFSVMPTVFGTLCAEVMVTDSMENRVIAERNVAVPVRETETQYHWEKSMRNVELTGNWRKDLLSVAESQLGYRESERNFVLNRDGVRHGYTRYGHWFGAEYQDWCAIFICFCLDYAGIPEENFPRSDKSADWRKLLIELDAYEETGCGYIPRTGDLIFFRTEEDVERPEHIGIVEKVIGTAVHTIEGNSGERVRRCEYALDDVMIVGYGKMGSLMALAGIEDPVPPDITKDKIPENGFVGITLGSHVNVRCEASRQSNIAAQISEDGAEVRVYGYEDTADGCWLYVEYNGTRGYILKDLIELVIPEA